VPDRPSPADNPTLYELLSEPAPSGGLRGETTITKETIDNDQEADQPIILLDGG
jgi:hypothetical protein